MRYYVVFPTGQRYGPADVQTLQLWVAENRVGPATTLMEESSGRTFPASQLPGLGLATVPGPQSGQPGPTSQMGQPLYTPYYRSYSTQSSSSSNTETTLAWVFGALGICVCGLSIAGIVLGALGIRKGQRGARAAFVFSICTLILPIVLRILLLSFVR